MATSAASRSTGKESNTGRKPADEMIQTLALSNIERDPFPSPRLERAAPSNEETLTRELEQRLVSRLGPPRSTTTGRSTHNSNTADTEGGQS